MQRLRIMIRALMGFSRTETNAFLVLLPLLFLIIFSQPIYNEFVQSSPPRWRIASRSAGRCPAGWLPLRPRRTWHRWCWANRSWCRSQKLTSVPRREVLDIRQPNHAFLRLRRLSRANDIATSMRSKAARSLIWARSAGWPLIVTVGPSPFLPKSSRWIVNENGICR